MIQVQEDSTLQGLLMWVTIILTTTFVVYWLYIAFPEVMLMFRKR